jgi:hypothetical protein
VQYQNLTVSAVGDAFRGPGTPPSGPGSTLSCTRDPYGFARADPNGGTFNSDRGTAASYDSVATVWNFTFGGHTGFSNDIQEDFTNNNGSNVEYYCGTTYMPNVPIIYNHSS